jgi:hypothetical protein
MLTVTPRAVIARRALLAAIPLGIVADPLLREGPWGVGLLIWMLAFAAILIAVMRQNRRRLSLESGTWLAVAVLFAAGLSWRDAEMLQFFDVLAMLTALGLLAMSISGVPVPGLAFARVRDLIRAGFETGLDVAVGVLLLLMGDAELQSAVRPAGNGKSRRIGRAVLITVPILLVFAILLTRADPVFGSYLKFLNVDLTDLVSHVAVAGFFACVVAGGLRRALLARANTATTIAAPLPLTLGSIDMAIALGALNVLFAAFVIAQLGWLFGGEALVLRTTGLGYAQYARRGFFELACVASLLLPVLLAAHALIPVADSRTLRLYRRLALPLVVLLGAIIGSAGARMMLYIHFYGISADRLYASAFMIWLAVVFVWLALTVLRARSRTFAAGFVASGFILLFALNCTNPEAMVARENLARGAAHNGLAGADVRYVALLGGDAVAMAVAELTASPVTGDATAQVERCAAARILLDRWSGIRAARMVGNWAVWNAGRSRAVAAVHAREVELRQLPCPVSSAPAATKPVP